MMQRNGVEGVEGIDEDLAGRGREARVERHAAGQGHLAAADVDALALLDVAEVDRVDAAPLVRDHRRLHVPDQRPLRRAEEGVALDVGRACASSEAAVLVLDEEFADQGFTEAL